MKDNFFTQITLELTHFILFYHLNKPRWNTVE